MSYSNTYNSGSNQLSKTYKQTMMLLSMTTLFSALMGFLNMQMNLAVNPLITLVVFFALSFFINKTRESSASVFLTFALTGWLGFTLGPIINIYLSVPNGSGIIMSAFGGTALIFLITTIIGFKKDFQLSNSMAKNLMITSLVALGVSLLNFYFFQMSILSVVISAFFLCLSSVYLTYMVSATLRDNPYINYVDATVTIFVSLFNIFVSLLNILGFASRD